MKTPANQAPAPTTFRERALAVVDDDENPRRTLEVTLHNDGAALAITETGGLDGMDRSFVVHISRADFLALVARLRRHEEVLR